MNKFIILFFLLSSSSLTYAEEERHIHVNGEHLSRQDIGFIDQLFGHRAESANYLINFQTGEWGYEGSTQVYGVIATIRQQTDYSQSINNTNNHNNGHTENYNSQNGSAISGRLNNKNCTFVSAGGMTMKHCD